jgi:hypothetical protein
VPYIELAGADNAGLGGGVTFLDAREAKELARTLNEAADTLTLSSRPHPDYCDHDETDNGQIEQHRGADIYVDADHGSDPTFVVAATALPDIDEARGYLGSTVQLTILRHGDDDVDVHLYPGAVRRLVVALEQALAAVQADDGAHPLNTS